MKKVTVLGCGNWGSSIANLIANDLDTAVFYDKIKLYTHECIVNLSKDDINKLNKVNASGVITDNKMKLSTMINDYHLNLKYLPDIILHQNIMAVTKFEDLSDTDILIICLPHQFLSTLVDLFKFIKNKDELVMVNLAKGLIFEDSKIYTPAEYIYKLTNKYCSTLQGANIASEISVNVVSETVIGYHDEFEIEIYDKLFSKRYFMVEYVKFTPTIEIFGAVKNVVALAYGIIVGAINENRLTNDIKYGTNTEVIILRRGINEILELIENEGFKDGQKMFFKSCGISDLFVTCMKGRNFKCGKLVASQKREFFSDKSNKIEDFATFLENKFNGQKIQGLDTVKTLYAYLKIKNEHNKYLLIKMVYEILYETEDLSPLYEYI